MALLPTFNELLAYRPLAKVVAVNLPVKPDCVSVPTNETSPVLEFNGVISDNSEILIVDIFYPTISIKPSSVVKPIQPIIKETQKKVIQKKIVETESESEETESESEETESESEETVEQQLIQKSKKIQANFSLSPTKNRRQT